MSLAGCGDSGGDSGGSGGGVISAFTDAVAAIIATTSDIIEAVSIDAIALVTSETSEPSAI